jgi:hypothetical protein
MDESVIVQVGGEGGDITLWGRSAQGETWEFRRGSTDYSWSMLDDEEGYDTTPGLAPEPVPVWVATWSEAITLLDRNPWAQLIPLSVHADFRQDVLVEVTRRLLAGSSPPIF